jgi:outer membrane biosynthesis protein TonB
MTLRDLLLGVAASVALAGSVARADQLTDQDRATEVILTKRRALTRCYLRELRASPAAAGAYLKIMVSMTIDPRGRVRQAHVEHSTASPTLDACTVGILKKLRFPRTADGLLLRYPLIFASGA